ncbi:MAG TPA: ABC transporter permease [Pyrinomonadaceae bacterium]
MSTSEKSGVLKAAVKTQSASDAAAATPRQDHVKPHLPSLPLVTIKPTTARSALDLRDLWAYRELLYFLMLRDIKVRYKQTVLGVVWVVMQPLLTTFIFTIFLGMLARVPSGGVPYPLLVFAGLMPWSFFSSSVVGSGSSLVSNANLITKVYFPRLIVPMAAVGGRLVDFGIAFLILAAMMLYYRVGLTWNILALPGLVVLTTLLALSLGMFISALNVKYRDVGVILPVLMQLWMFVSPVLYPLSLVPENWRMLYSLNPLVGVIVSFRAAVLGEPFNLPALAVTCVFTLVMLFYSAYTFRRVERSFADVI